MADALDALSLVNQPSAKPSTGTDTGLGRDAFLKIFLAQLETQDPLNPQDATQLSTQLAQFSQLEQTLRSTNQLESIGSKLDELIEVSGGGKTRLDPVSLIGREVEFEGKTLSVSSSADAPAVAGEVANAPRSLVFTVKDRATGKQAIAILAAPAGEDGQPRNLPAGPYRLRIEDGGAVLKAPTAEGSLEFRPMIRRPDGTQVPDETANPFEFVRGATYDVEMIAISPNQEQAAVALRRSGVVSSVRIQDGMPILKIDGADVDITTIQQIR